MRWECAKVFSMFINGMAERVKSETGEEEVAEVDSFVYLVWSSEKDQGSRK